MTRFLAAIGLDADDLRVLAVVGVVVLLMALVIILLAGAFGLALNVFEGMRGL